MVTKEQAMRSGYGDRFHYTGKRLCARHVTPRGGIITTVTEARVTGKCQTWKTRPNEFRLPVKYGLYESNAIDHMNAGDWHSANDCPLRNKE